MVTADSSEDEQIRETLESLPTDVDLRLVPHTTNGLTLYPLHGQSIHGKIDIRPRTLGILADGFDEYLDERLIKTHEIPSTYSNWDDEFANATHGRNESPILEGPVGDARDSEEACQFCFRSDYVRAAVRIISGGGHFNENEYTFYEAIPFGVVEGNGVSIAIAPLHRTLNEAEDPIFTYTATEGTDNFEIIREKQKEK